MPPPNPKNESVTVNYLRGLAALGVVLLHVRIYLWVGWNALQAMPTASMWDRAVAWLSIPTPFLGSGVTLFFLLSGFCIALPYVGGGAARPLILREYGIRRFMRIYPPYLAVVTLTLGCEAVLAWRGWGDLAPQATYLATTGMVQNYTTGQIASNGSLWSLPIEMELYLVFPLVYWLLERKSPWSVLMFSGLVSGLALAGYAAGHGWLAVNFAKYWVVWCGGAVLARYYARGKLKRPPVWYCVVGVIGLGCAIAGQKRIDSVWLDIPYGLFFVAVLWWGLTTDHLWGPRLPRWLAWGLNGLGSISYSLYLIHYPLFKLWGAGWVACFGHKPINFLIPLGFSLLAVGAAAVFYRIIELPSHRWAKVLAGRKPFGSQR